MAWIEALIQPLLRPFGYRLINQKRRPARPWELDPSFDQLVARVQGRTLLSNDRLFFIYQYARHACAIAGDVAEVGVYKGGSAFLLASVLRETDKTLHLFDTFVGMPGVDVQRDNTAFVRTGLFDDTSETAVREFLAEFDRVRTHAGFFPETAGPVEERRFAMVYIDVDIYQSTLDCLGFFYPRMTAGGVMLLDDYKSPKCPGVAQAVAEYLADKPESPIHTTVNQAAVIRLGG